MIRDSHGGPAFPRPFSSLSNGGYSLDQDGMSVRQYYAVVALQGLLSGGCVPWCYSDAWPDCCAPAVQRAFELADAMLEHERKERLEALEKGATAPPDEGA